GKQSALLALNAESQRDLINSAIEHAWHACRSTPSSEGQQNIQKLEAKRMQQILSQWLELEKQRPPFEVIETEKRFKLSLPENSARTFELKLTADRIDHDQSGRQILLDYKTGAKQSHGKWLDERMEQPQLPLYAMAADLGESDAVAFASVRSGNDMGFEGLSGDDTEIPGIAICDGKRGRPDDWQDVLKQWRDNLNALATEFADGRSDVSPRNSKACTYCSFEAICRIEETGFIIQNEESE
ncbi:MAG TPA: PD-(D/E)XK nuclease family protein, partial [Mariprofundaceae bacterium]|nr:PD-(D/E)XK nuclease family protein [Mariprofundaceae bacterium]